MKARLRDDRTVATHVNRPTGNAFVERFSGQFRAECLNPHRFMSPDDAKAKMEAWRRDTNDVRPHSAIGHKTPIAPMNRPDGSPPA